MTPEELKQNLLTDLALKGKYDFVFGENKKCTVRVQTNDEVIGVQPETRLFRLSFDADTLTRWLPVGRLDELINGLLEIKSDKKCPDQVFQFHHHKAMVVANDYPLAPSLIREGLLDMFANLWYKDHARVQLDSGMFMKVFGGMIQYQEGLAFHYDWISLVAFFHHFAADKKVPNASINYFLSIPKTDSTKSIEIYALGLFRTQYAEQLDQIRRAIIQEVLK